LVQGRSAAISEAKISPQRIANDAQYSDVMVKHFDPMNGHMEIDSGVYEALDRLFALCQTKKQQYIQKQIQKRSMLCPKQNHDA
jgi:hypothetical protein